jgi:hypothetical protein
MVLAEIARQPSRIRRMKHRAIRPRWRLNQRGSFVLSIGPLLLDVIHLSFE